MGGIIGVAARTNCVPSLVNGMWLLSHRGPDWYGFDVVNQKKEFLGPQIFQGSASSLEEENLEHLTGHLAIGYLGSDEAQPFAVTSSKNSFSVAYSGNITNAEKLKADLLNQGDIFASGKDVGDDIQIIAHLIAKSQDIIEGIRLMAYLVEGAFSLVVLTKDGIFTATDSYGRRPLVIGSSGEGNVVATESSPFWYLGLETEREVGAGEIIFMDPDGVYSLDFLPPAPRRALCAFEFVYYMLMASISRGVSVEILRIRLGELVAEKIKSRDIKASMVAPIPDSGIGMSLGLSRGLGLPLAFILQRHPNSGRSFTKAKKHHRSREARRKLIPVISLIKDEIIIIGDDSRVTGNQGKHLGRLLKEKGAKEIYMAYSCPPLMHSCPFTKPQRRNEELIAYVFGGDEAKINSEMGLEGSFLPSLEDFLKVFEGLGLSREELCLACWNGEYY